jgi:hypothetical protein
VDLSSDRLLMNEWFRIASKETGLEVNAEITKCMVLSRDQDAGRKWEHRGR